MNKELQALDNLTKGAYCPKGTELCTDCSICEKNTSISIIKKALQDYETLKILNENQKHNIEMLMEENKFLRESNKNLDETYFETWRVCEELKKSSNYALMFIDDIYCLVDTKDNKFDVVDNYKINNYGVIENKTQKKLKVLEIIKKRFTIQFIESDLPNYYGIMQIGINPIYVKTKEEFDLLKEVLL